MRVVAVAELLEPLDAQACVSEGGQEVVQREMNRSYAHAYAVRMPDSEGGSVVAAGSPVARGELRHPLRLQEERMRPDEARVAAHVDERGARSQDTRDLGDGCGELVDVGMRPEGDGGVEACVAEGQRVRRRLDDFQTAGSRTLQEVARDVDADDGPAERGDRQGRDAGPAADVQAAAVPRAQQP